MFIADYQPPEVTDPGDGAFHLPSPLVSPQFSTILGWRLATIGFVWTDQIDAPPLQTFAQRIGIGRLVVDQPRGIFSRSAPSPRHRYPIQRRFDQRRFVRGRAGKLYSQRNTLAACHHHPLRTLSAFGLSNAIAPFFAGAKLPSAKVSSQSSRPASSNSPRNLRQIANQTSCSSQSRSRRQQVLGEGYWAGRSFQRAPDLRTHRMPSKHRRSSTLGLPPRREALGFGSKEAILFHCSSVSSGSCRDIKRIPFHVTLNHKSLSGANLPRCGF